jgi:2'-5' RNA ligase
VSAERARLFVALELPREVQCALVRWRSPVVEAIGALRAVPEESLHLTLCFLGAIAAGMIEAVGEAVANAIRGAPATLSLGPALWLPPHRPRVLGVRVLDPSGALSAAQSALSETLVGGRWYEPDSRPFLPHVTVARVGRGARVRADELPDPPLVAFDGLSVTLFRSLQGADGVRYQALRRVG